MRMFLIILVLLAIPQIEGFGQKDSRNNISSSDTAKSDSLEYKLVVLDPGFESWLISQLPENYYSLQYYETWNRLYVTEWNSRYMQSSRNRGLYNTIIDYDPQVNYGLELNYRLYYYFRFFELTNHVNLLYSDR